MVTTMDDEAKSISISKKTNDFYIQTFMEEVVGPSNNNNKTLSKK